MKESAFETETWRTVDAEVIWGRDNSDSSASTQSMLLQPKLLRPSQIYLSYKKSWGIYKNEKFGTWRVHENAQEI